MKPCLSGVTTLPASFADDVAHLAAAGCPAYEVWLTKLEKYLEANPVADAVRLLENKGVTPAAASYQGGLLLSQGEERKAHFDHFRRRLDLCQYLRIPLVVVAADFARKPTQTDLERAVVSLAQAGQWAASAGVKLALEFRAGNAFCASLDTAVALTAGCGEPNVGVALDVFHYYCGPSKPEDLELLTRDNLFFVQVSDLAGTPRELASDSDRVLPGDGDFRFGPVLDRLRAIGYDGYVSAEVMNPALWQMRASQVADVGFAAVSRLLG